MQAETQFCVILESHIVNVYPPPQGRQPSPPVMPPSPPVMLPSPIDQRPPSPTGKSLPAFCGRNKNYAGCFPRTKPCTRFNSRGCSPP
nr:hypothetical protein CFP56_79719 [Quercus suber]